MKYLKNIPVKNQNCEKYFNIEKVESWNKNNKIDKQKWKLKKCKKTLKILG